MELYSMFLKHGRNFEIGNVDNNVVELFQKNAVYWFGDAGGGLFLFDADNLQELIEDLNLFYKDNCKDLIKKLKRHLKRLEKKDLYSGFVFYLII